MDPAVGEWISEDPIGFDGGDTNLTRYANNSAIISTDPTGTITIKRDGTNADNFKPSSRRPDHPMGGHTYYKFDIGNEKDGKNDFMVFYQKINASGKFEMNTERGYFSVEWKDSYEEIWENCFGQTVGNNVPPIPKVTSFRDEHTFSPNHESKLLLKFIGYEFKELPDNKLCLSKGADSFKVTDWTYNSESSFELFSANIDMQHDLPRNNASIDFVKFNRNFTITDIKLGDLNIDTNSAVADALSSNKKFKIGPGSGDNPNFKPTITTINRAGSVTDTIEMKWMQGQKIPTMKLSSPGYM